jgi:hypothetical protein
LQSKNTLKVDYDFGVTIAMLSPWSLASRKIIKMADVQEDEYTSHKKQAWPGK